MRDPSPSLLRASRALGLLGLLSVAGAAEAAVPPLNAIPAAEFPAPGGAPVVVLRVAGEDPRVLRYAGARGAVVEVAVELDTKTSATMESLALPPRETIRVRARARAEGPSEGRIGVSVEHLELSVAPKASPMTEVFQRAAKGATLRGSVGDRGLDLRGDWVSSGRAPAPEIGAALTAHFRAALVPLPAEAVGIGGQWDVLTIMEMGTVVVRRALRVTLTARTVDHAEVGFALHDASPAAVEHEADGASRTTQWTGSGEGKARLDLTHPLGAHLASTVRGKLVISDWSRDVCKGMMRPMWCSSHGSNGVSVSTHSMETVATVNFTPKRLEPEITEPTEVQEAEDPDDEFEDEEDEEDEDE